MSKKIYQFLPDGSITFRSERKGYTTINNYVIDLWTPLIGIEGLGLYLLYCRLERERNIRGITQTDIAQTARIGKYTLQMVNKLLVEQKFIAITAPTGMAKRLHYTCEIVIYDPPECIPVEVIESLKPAYGYRPLTTWLIGSESSNQNHEEVPDRTLRKFQIEPRESSRQNRDYVLNPLSLESLEVEEETPPGNFETQNALGRLLRGAK